MVTFTLTCVGDDRPGLLSALAAPISAHGASWERSQMTRLAGKFAGVLLVRVPDGRAESLVADLTQLEHVGLHVAVERTTGPTTGPYEQPAARLELDLLGSDRPGIVAEISAALAARMVSIEEITTAVLAAPMAGGMLFEAHAVLTAPQATDIEGLRSTLEAIADELMVELTLSETDEVRAAESEPSGTDPVGLSRR